MMEPLSKLIETAEKKDWGVEAKPEWDKFVLISQEGLHLIKNSEEIQSLIEKAENYAVLDFVSRLDSTEWDKYKKLGGESEADIYLVPVDGVNIAFKVYHEDRKRGLKYFDALIRTKNENIFDTVTPYLATEDYILMSVIPELPDYYEFIAEHPEEKKNIDAAIRKLQVETEIGDFGFCDHRHLKEQPDEDREAPVKHVYISKYDPNSSADRFRFFVIDMYYHDNP